LDKLSALTLGIKKQPLISGKATKIKEGIDNLKVNLGEVLRIKVH
jgi:hypothetical protein